MKRELVEETKRKMNHSLWQLSCTILLRTMDLHTPNLREWFSTSFKTSTWLKMHIICTTQQGSKNWMTNFIIFMASPPMSTTKTTLGMSEGDGSEVMHCISCCILCVCCLFQYFNCLFSHFSRLIISVFSFMIYLSFLFLVWCVCIHIRCPGTPLC